MKIYKRSKQSVQSSYLNRNIQMKNNENFPNLIAKTAPNEKEVQVKSETHIHSNED